MFSLNRPLEDVFFLLLKGLDDFLRFKDLLGFWVSLLFIVRELQGEGSLAVAVAISDR